MRDAATTQLEHARALRDSGAVEGALTAYRRLIARFSAYHGIEIRLPVAMAMMRMKRELRSGKVPGFLGDREAGGVTIQYWSSTEALIAYARDHAGEHFPAWADFNKRIRKTNAVGVWHETFSAPATGIMQRSSQSSAASIAASCDDWRTWPHSFA